MKKEDYKKPQDNEQQAEANTMRQRKKKINTTDLSKNKEINTDQNSDPILAKKQ